MLSILGNTCCWPVRLLCRVLDVHPSGLYAWLQQPHSQRHQADLRLTGQIKQFWLESGCVYGYRKIHLDLRDSGQQYGVNRVWRLMKRIGIKAQVGYRSPRACKGEASIVSPNRLQRQFNPDAPDERWVTDITYIRTHEGWLYLAVVVDLFSRKIIGWSMHCDGKLNWLLSDSKVCCTWMLCVQRNLNSRKRGYLLIYSPHF